MTVEELQAEYERALAHLEERTIEPGEALEALRVLLVAQIALHRCACPICTEGP